MSDPFSAPGAPDAFGAPRNRLRLRRVGVFSVGLFSGAAGVIVGLSGGFFIMLVGAVGAAGAQGGQNAGALLGMGAGAMIMGPLFYGIAGFLGGVVNGVIYNILAGMTGGIEVEFEQG